MRERIDDFRQLRVYRLGFESAQQIYEVSMGWPAQERYALTDQIRRSSRAVCATIAEAWFKRRYPKHFVSKLSDAGAEAAETLVWLDFAEAAGLLTDPAANTLQAAYQQIQGGLVKMMAHPEQWCLPTNALREPEGGYDAASDIFV